MRFRMSISTQTYTPEEMMTIAAARRFRDGATCFVGVGLPSVAACVARHVHAPGAVLVYESGAIGARPSAPPLSIADFELAETADLLVTVPEIFSYWLQGGRIETGFLGAAQIDRFANLNSTVIGEYGSPKVRLPGAGGAPQIAAYARDIVVIGRHSPKLLVSRVDFITSVAAGTVTVITDLGILVRDPATRELALKAYHPGVSVDQIREATGWPLQIAADCGETPAPSVPELAAVQRVKQTQRHQDTK
jgi:glutaconate CoA-transferase subunit B